MSYQNYVIGAYAVFAVAMLWDYIAPKLQLRAALRAVRARAARSANRASATNTELQR